MDMFCRRMKEDDDDGSKRFPGKRKVKNRCMDNIRHDINKSGLKKRDAQDRSEWRRMVQTLNVAGQLKKKALYLFADLGCCLSGRWVSDVDNERSVGGD